MYNKKGRSTRLQHLGIPFYFVPFAVLLPESMLAIVLTVSALLVLEAGIVYLVWPDIRSVALQVRRWSLRNFGRYWYPSWRHGRYA
jgi:hypothetical protein